MPALTLVAATLCVNSTTEIAIPASAPMRSNRLGKARADVEFIGLNGNISIALGIQNSDDALNWTNHTSAGDLFISFTTTSTVVHAGSYTDVSTLTNAKQYFRFVWYAKLTSGTTLATGYAQGNVDILPMT